MDLTNRSIAADAVLGNFVFCDDFELTSGRPTLSTLDFAIEMMQDEVEECVESLSERQLANLVKEFADVAVIALNGMYKTLLNMGYAEANAKETACQAFRAVVDNNNSKRQSDGTVTYREDGKVLKPEGFKKLDMGEFLYNLSEGIS